MGPLRVLRLGPSGAWLVRGQGLPFCWYLKNSTGLLLLSFVLEGYQIMVEE